MAYVYRHIRLDKNEPFYIGIGSDPYGCYRRAYEGSLRRNKIWNDINSKSEIRVEILIDGLTWEEAREKEKEFITLYGRKDIGTGILANMTEGGDGVVGYTFTEEARNKITKALLGSKRKPLSDELKKKISESVKNRGFKPNEEQRRKMSACNSGGNNSAAKLVLNLENGIYYDCAKDASITANINTNYFRSMLSGNDRNRTQFIYA